MESVLGRNKHTNEHTFGHWAHIAIANHYAKISKHEVGVINDNDPEELHETRVGIRRLGSAIQGFGAALQLPAQVNDKKVGKIGKKLGTLRDLDVLQLALIEQHLPNLPSSEQKHFKDGLVSLKHQRQQAFQSTKKLLRSDLYLEFKKALEQWLADPHYQAIAKVPIEYILADLLLPQISQLLLHPGWWIGTTISDDQVKLSDDLTPEAIDKILNEQGTILHDLRKAAKRSRYTLELFSDFYDQSYTTYFEYIKSVQQVLGDFQDSQVLAEFIQNSFQVNWEKDLPQFAQNLTQLRFERWQQWQKLQSQFLDLAFRNHFHLVLLNPTFDRAKA